MSESLKLKAPAKINLRLEVTGKRPDGYHRLRMVNTLVNLYDEIRISLNQSGMIRVSCGHPLVPCGIDNIAVKAANAILNIARDKRTGVMIMLRKRIPVAAGLAGGSSDAAAVLLGMNKAMNLDIPESKLLKIALSLGADVPFFLHGKPALVTGIGEKIEPIKDFPQWSYLLVCPEFQVSTAWVYKRFRLKKEKHGMTKDQLLARLAKGRAEQDLFINHLEDVVVREYPVVSELKESLLEAGASGSVMSGSGPCVAGVFQETDQAKKAERSLKKRYPQYFCKTVRAVPGLAEDSE
jgi:4-diphosphocytidyl-2-C-methyl-D-erythritol kinase